MKIPVLCLRLCDGQSEAIWIWDRSHQGHADAFKSNKPHVAEPDAAQVGEMWSGKRLISRSYGQSAMSSTRRLSSIAYTFTFQCRRWVLPRIPCHKDEVTKISHYRRQTNKQSSHCCFVILCSLMSCAETTVNRRYANDPQHRLFLLSHLLLCSSEADFSSLNKKLESTFAVRSDRSVHHFT